ncbi:hypothetical protein [Pedobacter immunditicola]|uniref:hypothetical protein n=1 Tax=Pedobacter immunditicola TaxID=3133440 RepID=UPI0030A011C1
MEEKEVQKINPSKLRLTPLNVITAMSFMAAAWMLFNGFGTPMEKTVNLLIFGLCILGAVVSFVSDLIFRKSIPSLKNLWIVEIAFLVFTVVLILIIKIVLF